MTSSLNFGISKNELKRLIQRNSIYFCCSLIYYLTTLFMTNWMWWSFFVISTTYLISLCIAFSSLGEKILRLLSNVRKLESAREKDYLRPLFHEVLNKAKSIDPSLDGIDIYILDSMAVNAIAIGKRTIAVTKGAMQTFSEDELKAIISHEIAHIHHMDTTAKIHIMVGNGILSFFLLVIHAIFWLVGGLFTKRIGRNGLNRAMDAIVSLFMFPMALAMAYSDRKSERRSDEFAITLGYGEEMVSALYLLEKINLSSDRPLIEKLLASHPRLTARIENLEIKLGIQEPECDKETQIMIKNNRLYNFLKGKSYGESWDILNLCGIDEIRETARYCSHDNAREAAIAILRERNENHPIWNSDMAIMASVVMFIVIVFSILLFEIQIGLVQ